MHKSTLMHVCLYKHVGMHAYMYVCMYNSVIPGPRNIKPHYKKWSVTEVMSVPKLGLKRKGVKF